MADSIDRKIDREVGSLKTTVKIDDAVFEIPNEFVVYATKAEEPYRNMAIIKLEFIWPEFLPTRLANTEELEAAKKLENYNIGRLWIIKAFPQKTKEALAITPKSDRIVKTEPDGEFQNFKKYKHYEMLYQREELKVSAESYILKDDNGQITDAIYCYGTIAPKSYPPQCEYHFVDKGLLYNVGFAEQPHMKNWAVWKAGSINFIDHFRVKQ